MRDGVIDLTPAFRGLRSERMLVTAMCDAGVAVLGPDDLSEIAGRIRAMQLDIERLSAVSWSTPESEAMAALEAEVIARQEAESHE